MLIGVLAACSTGSTPGGASRQRPATSGAATSRTAPELALVRRDGATYRVPSPLPPGRPGDLLAASDLGPDPLIAGARRWLVLYHSRDVHDRDTAVSGVVLLPAAPVPRGGWPVVSWGHGTTGVADRCAPSQTPRLYYNEYAQEAATVVRAGYAVVATDFGGLGTPGPHGYLVGADEGNAMVDMVTAARHLSPALSTTWFAVGHSQGGQAALFATRAAARAPGLHLAGTVAIAPASSLELLLPAVLSGGDPSDLTYGLYSLIGLSTVDPQVKVADLLGPLGRARLPAVLDGECLEETDKALSGQPTAQIFQSPVPDALVSELSAELRQYGDPDTSATVGPVLVVQGSDDQDVPAGLTDAMVKRLQALGSDVTQRVYPGLDHDRVIGPSACDVLAWLTQHGGPIPPPCTPYATDLS